MPGGLLDVVMFYIFNYTPAQALADNRGALIEQHVCTTTILHGLKFG
jgi:hypothetical protein